MKNFKSLFVELWTFPCNFNIEQLTVNTSEDVGKEPLFTAGDSTNWRSHYGDQYGGFAGIKELPYDPFIPPGHTAKELRVLPQRHLDIYPCSWLFYS